MPDGRYPQHIPSAAYSGLALRSKNRESCKFHHQGGMNRRSLTHATRLFSTSPSPKLWMKVSQKNI
jgi:hypothetical protein